MKSRARIAGLYAIADTQYLEEARLAPAVAEAIAGGARVVQYRDKSGDHERRRREARALAELCRRHGVPFLVNDDLALALAAGADGLHLGRGDVALAEARRRLGDQAVAGVSCYNELGCALAAEAGGAGYVAFGSFFPSATKPQAVRADVELLRAARARLAIPIVAIGGVTPENGAALIAAGADALAVISGLFGPGTDTRAAAARYARLFVG